LTDSDLHGVSTSSKGVMMQRSLQRRLWCGFIVGSAAIAFSLCTSAAEPAASNSQSLDVGGYALHLRVSPGCAPAVLLEAGGEMDSSEWSALQPEINAVTGSAVVSYDRPGYGDSSLPERNLTLNDEVEALHRALQRLDIPRPVVLVGHSYGAFLVQVYAHRYPEETRGIVLVDPNTVAFMDAIGGPGKLDLSIPPDTPPQLARAASREIASFAASIEEARAAPLSKSLPVTVIAAEKRWGPTDQFNDAFAAARKSLVGGLPHGSLVVADGSGHVIPAERPDVVLAAVAVMIKHLKTTTNAGRSCRR
jgi:pimeloyl-ACP methyl ester carboxylesterase